MRALWLWLPEEALTLVIVGVGFALMLRVIRGRTALGVLGVVALLLLLGPFVEALIETLPLWLILLLGIWFLLATGRALLALFIGRRAADEAVGSLAASAIGSLFRLLIGFCVLPFRILWWCLRRV